MPKSQGNELLKFLYVNWRGEEHEYVIEPRGMSYSTISHGKEEMETHWVLHGDVVTRDGDPRSDMGTRRRSFIIAKMQVIQEVDASA